MDDASTEAEAPDAAADEVAVADEVARGEAFPLAAEADGYDRPGNGVRPESLIPHWRMT